MSLWQSVQRWFKSEAKSVRDLSGELQEGWSADLSLKEAELAATPEERIGRLQDQISDNSSVFDEIRAKIDTSGTDFDVDSDSDDSRRATESQNTESRITDAELSEPDDIGG